MAPLTLKSITKENSNLQGAKMDQKISDELRACLTDTQKWRAGDDRFFIKVPALPSTRALRDYLWRVQGEPMATYHRLGVIGPVAHQWSMRLPEWRKLWALKSPTLES